MPLPAANRLPLRKERDRLQKEGKTFHTRHFTVLTAPTSASPPQGQALKGTNPQGLALTEFSENSSLVIPAKAGIHPVPRFSILLSKKTARLAVDRNLIRRRTSALLAEILAQPASPKEGSPRQQAGFPPADYLVIPKRSALDTPHHDLLADLTSLLPKLK